MLRKIVASVAVALALCCTPAFAELAQNWRVDGPAVMGTAATVTNKALATNVATLTTAAPHGFMIGQAVVINIGDPVFDGRPGETWTITGIPTATSFTYARTNADVASTAAAGTVQHAWFPTSAENRSMSFNATSGNLLVARQSPGIHVLNPATGASIGEVPCSGDITQIAKTGNVVTVTLATNHNLVVNQRVRVNLVPPDAQFDGTADVTGVPTANSFTYTLAGADVPAAPATGKVLYVFGGTLNLVKIRALPAGIFGCNLSVNAQSATDVFSLYHWPDENTPPRLIYRNTASDVAPIATAVGPQLPAATNANTRIGDQMDAVQSGTTVEVFVPYARQGAVGPSNKVWKLTYDTVSGTITGTSEIVLTGASTANAAVTGGGIAVDGVGGQIYRVSSVEFARYDNDGSNRTVSVPLLTSNSGGTRVGTVNGKKYLTFQDPQTAGEPFRLYVRTGVALIEPDNGGGFAKAAILDYTPARPGNGQYPFTNGNGSADCDFDDQTARPGRFFVCHASNFVGSFTIPTGTGVTKTFTNGGGDFLWTNPANWSGGTVPTAIDDVVLDNSSVAGPYQVEVAGTTAVACRTLTIGNAVDNGNRIGLRVTSVGQGATLTQQTVGFGKTDFTITGTYRKPINVNETINPTFIIEIDSVGATDTFRWNNAGHTTAANFSNAAYRSGASNVAMTGAPQPLSDGYSITWASTTGHTLANRWLFDPKGIRSHLVVSGDQNDATPDILVRNRGEFVNFANLTGGNIVEYRSGGNTMVVANGGSYLHESNRSFATPFPATGDGALICETGSSVAFDVIGGLAVAASGRTYGSLVLKNQYFGFRPDCPYTCTGGSPFTILDALVVEAGARLTPTMTGDTIVGGDVTNNGTDAAGTGPASLNLFNTAATTGTLFNGTSVVGGASPVLLPNGFWVADGASLTLSQATAVPAGKTAQVDGTLVTNGALTVAGTLNLSANAVTGSGSVAVGAGASLGVKAAGGIDGQVTATGPNTFDVGAGYVFNGAAAQVTGASLPATVAGLRVNNAAGVTLSSPVSVTGVLDLVAGELVTGANALLAADGAPAVTRTAGFVNGTLQRTVDAAVAGARVFPVGTAGAYAPVSINITTAGAGSGPVSVNSVATDAPGLAQPTLAIDRHWNLSAPALSGYTAELVFEYPAADVTGGVEANFVALRDDGVWSAPGTSVADAVNHKVTVSGVTGLSVWTVGEPAAITASVNDWTLY